MYNIATALASQVLLLGTVKSVDNGESVLPVKSQIFNTENSKLCQAIDFVNVGFTGSYLPVSSLNDIEKDTCSCDVGERVWFSGNIAPIDDAVTVHFRGPLKLHKFAFYTSPYYVLGNPHSGDWERMAHYDSSTQKRENVTFLNKEGPHSLCLGKALSYADDSGIASAVESTTLSDEAVLSSDEEFVIFSELECPPSAFDGACGVYREGIPAYHGFDGDTKMFLFEFEMPTEPQTPNPHFEFYDMPAIWLLNAHIPRTAQYPNNVKCSCWASGCGEFDIFEVMNSTEVNHLYSAFHTFQGIDDVGIGIQAPAYLERDPHGIMAGGVIFDSKGYTRVFFSDKIDFDDDVITASTLYKIMNSISPKSVHQSKLTKVSIYAPMDDVKSIGIKLTQKSSIIAYSLVALTTLILYSKL
ncbi:Toh1p Ecym_8110 [Eremothecium cymbalariae DBVPG|uniref:glucan endo-1,3-beta-D-glucosidase n=1 Tax=Eremothecium cymbalariae (strain CBS 270.75 / DBVPG 7215 / KCTC 17166 / NRRL Y-17582) TaxID=931890 RepID=G8JX30_ERECY|nr:Hypothetical protein Ecym_8110 [Eremothecium cymbalariae DBVPG\